VTSIYLLLAGTAVLVGTIYGLVQLAEKEARADEQARAARERLSSMERFNETMGRPLATGSDLVRSLRRRVLPHSGAGDAAKVPSADDGDDR